MSSRKQKNGADSKSTGGAPLDTPRRLDALRDNKPYVIDTPINSAELKAALPKSRRSPIEAHQAVVEAAFRVSTTPQLRRRIRDARAAAIVVTVPSPSWVAPVSAFLNGRLEASTYLRDGSDRKLGSGVGNDAVARALAEGKNISGFSGIAESRGFPGNTPLVRGVSGHDIGALRPSSVTAVSPHRQYRGRGRCHRPRRRLAAGAAGLPAGIRGRPAYYQGLRALAGTRDGSRAGDVR